MAFDSLVYSLIQIFHNLGAALTLGAPVLWLMLRPADLHARSVLGLLAFAWALQGVSGAGFGTASWLIYGRFPDLMPIALGALGVKILCMLSGAALSLYLLIRRPPPATAHWVVLALLSATALIGAALLRWNS